MTGPRVSARNRRRVRLLHELRTRDPELFDILFGASERDQQRSAVRLGVLLLLQAVVIAVGFWVAP